MSQAEPHASAPARPAEGGGHEALLRRHGLISHVARLPDDTPPAEAARFQREASGVARNLIPLSALRFGVLLDTPDRPLSTVAYQLENAQPAPAATPAPADAAVPGRGPGGTEAGAGADGAALSARLDRIEAWLEGLAPDTVADRLAPALDALVARRIEALEDRLRAGRPAPAPKPAPKPASAPEPYPQARVDAFWSGLEEALRLLHDQIVRLEAAAQAPQGGGAEAIAELESAVALGFEAAGEAREANHAALEGRLAALERDAAAPERIGEALAPISERLDGLERRLAAGGNAEDAASAVGHRLAEALAPICERLSEIERRLDAGPGAAATEEEHAAARGAGVEAHAELVSAIAALGDGLAALIDDRLPAGAVGRIAAAPDRLDERLDTALAAAARIEARLDAPGAAEQPAEGRGSLVADLDGRFDALARRLEARGGLLSETLETSHRSIKNFWLATEDALGRLNAALGRLEPPGDGAPAPGGAGRDETPAAPLEAIAARLDRIETRLAESARECAEPPGRQTGAGPGGAGAPPTGC